MSNYMPERFIAMFFVNQFEIVIFGTGKESAEFGKSIKRRQFFLSCFILSVFRGNLIGKKKNPLIGNFYFHNYNLCVLYHPTFPRCRVRKEQFIVDLIVEKVYCAFEKNTVSPV